SATEKVAEEEPRATQRHGKRLHPANHATPHPLVFAEEQSLAPLPRSAVFGGATGREAGVRHFMPTTAQPSGKHDQLALGAGAMQTPNQKQDFHCNALLILANTNSLQPMPPAHVFSCSKA